ncbi:MAG: DUF362 domain-containing protein [Candidatus Aminicenantes bacterium]|nr:DUF362 domain-containing protein [Candidatus Aminicenantes bacterium]NIM82937.1 DUF362 domain-containing protein [Candidatus Aminicenantes bacterium]NIN22314.1 DUF362 domain-containing protein [Candidatus Aminicenantes bacterium]NIN46082.1 DUF362 domain-containing protein [Candidatus Aminicenantes bacterium]NIN88918.1 DUF362 domain-containing protein [Candidatus Aminicenantes bacterium]
MKIYYRKTGERRPFVEKVLEIFKDEIQGRKRVLIKPNIVSSEKYPTTTHVDTLEVVLSFLSKFGCEVIVGDGPAIDVSSKKVMRSHILKDICDKHNVNFMNFYEEEMSIRIDNRGRHKLKMSNIPFACDYIISLPLLKTHYLKHIGISCALKNQFGYLCKWQRFKAHMGVGSIHKYIAGINSIVKTDLYIIDALEVMLNGNEIRHGGHRAKLGIMFAGKDPLSLDAYGLKLLNDLGEKKLLGKRAEDIGYIQQAVLHNLGSKNYDLLKI